MADDDSKVITKKDLIRELADFFEQVLAPYLDKQFEEIDKHFEKHDNQLEEIVGHLDRYDRRFDKLDDRLDRHGKMLDSHEEIISRFPLPLVKMH